MRASRSPDPVFPDGPEPSYSRFLHRERGDALLIASWLGPDGVVDAVDEARLSGRGGAWFPTAVKWRTTRSHAERERTRTGLAPVLVVNAAEGEPGSFKDRWLVRNQAFGIVEGAVIAAAVIGADTIVFAVKQSFVRERACLADAIAAVGAAVRAPRPELMIVDGPERYLFGEETAMLEVVAGRPPFPRLSPPWRHGALDMGDRGAPAATPFAHEADDGPAPPPALVHNVETLARVARIVRDTELDDVDPRRGSSTFLATITGAVRRPRVEEVPMGTPLRSLLDDDGAGVGAVLNGVSYPLISPASFDDVLGDPAESEGALPVGAAALQVFDEATPARSIAAAAARFLAIESCGQCRPCKTEGLAIAQHLASSGPATTDDAVDRGRELVAHAARVTDGARCGLAGQQQDLVDGLLARFPDALLAGPGSPDDAGVIVAPIADLERGAMTYDRGFEELQPDWSDEERWSGSTPAEVIDTASGGRA